MGKFINIHKHSIFSNSSMAECISFPHHYIDNAIKSGVDAIAFTEHGSILSWVSKKQQANKAGLKYIHGIEAYVTDNLEEKIRDNNHLILLAKNYEGVKEINRLSTMSFKGLGNKKSDDPHFYYSPRLTFEEIANTSDNVLILTACLGSPFYQAYKKQDKEKFTKWMNFAIENKHRVWLELQPHNHPEQIVYNKILLGIANKHGMNIVATNDVHAHSEKADKMRKILMKSRGIYFDDDSENTFELWDKDYDEMYESFKTQGVLTDDEIERALAESIKIADMIEDFELDTSAKYPSLFKDPDARFKRRIVEGFKHRGIDKLPPEEQQVFKDRVKKELADYKHTGSDVYILLEDYIKQEMRKEGRYPGYGRGSATGSVINYLLQITEVDPIKEDLSFERFINRDRVSLADIDSDWSAADRVRVQEFLLSHPELKCNAIITYNTYGYKSAIKTVGGQFGYSRSELQNISNEIIDGEIPQSLYDDHPELMEMVDATVGVIASVGRHAAGVIVSDRDLSAELGSIEVKDFEFPVSAIDMKEVDSLNYVKFDVLGLDNIELIKRTCDLAKIPFATPLSDFIDFQDEKVWKSMAESNVAIFQFDATDRAGKILKEVFSDQTLSNIKKRLGNDVKYLDLLSLANAAQRPSGASFIEAIMEGQFTENGHKALNDFLKDTLGNLTYQEQQIKFLTDFCGYSGPKADIIRRAIGKKKKEVIDEEVPKIREAFIQTMQDRYGDNKDHAEEIADAFMQIFLDSANYSFSKNHSVPYSYIGYISAWLRYYYPLEFLTSGMEVWDGNLAKTNKLIEYCDSRGIEVKTPKFRYSRGGYFFNKEENAIYQGTAPIKGNNATAGDILYDVFHDRHYDCFTDFLVDLREDTTFTINGNKIKLLDIYKNSDTAKIEAFDKNIKASINKNTWSPYKDKTLINSFNKWTAKNDSDGKIQEAITQGYSDGVENIMDIEYIRERFDDWRFNIFKGKKKWLEYENAMDIDIETAQHPVDRSKIESLIKLNYFSEFGKNKKLMQVFEEFDKNYKQKNKTYKGKFEAYKKIVALEKRLEDESFTVFQQCLFELEYTGRVTVVSDTIPKNYGFVTEILNVGTSRTSAVIYNIQAGKSIVVKVPASAYRQAPFDVGDILEVEVAKQKPKRVKENGQWKTSKTEKENWIDQYRYMRKEEN